ncbi:MAG: hypothetical protein IJC99_03325 [Clostridia bacterium]|nr:hypothetical protein [Clostridia bacterium]
MLTIIAFAALPVGGVLWACLHTPLPFYIALAFAATLLVWAISDNHPKLNAVITFGVGLAGAVMVQITGPFWVWSACLAWIGYMKTHGVWGEVAYFSYRMPDEKIYRFFEEDGTDAIHLVATGLSIALYLAAGLLVYLWTPLAFLVAAFLLYRMLRVICVAK